MLHSVSSDANRSGSFFLSIGSPCTISFQLHYQNPILKIEAFPGVKTWRLEIKTFFSKSGSWSGIKRAFKLLNIFQKKKNLSEQGDQVNQSIHCICIKKDLTYERKFHQHKYGKVNCHSFQQ
jgi:hypothetical protein